MKAFAKTLFGDARNVGVVAVLIAVSLGLVGAGQGALAVYLVPILAMAGIIWLAHH